MANEAGQQVYDGLVKRGFAPLQAAVIAGNVQQESSFDPTAWNPKEQAGGLIQWRMDRLDGLMDYAKKTGREPGDPEAQLAKGHLRFELFGRGDLGRVDQREARLHRVSRDRWRGVRREAARPHLLFEAQGDLDDRAAAAHRQL